MKSNVMLSRYTYNEANIQHNPLLKKCLAKKYLQIFMTFLKIPIQTLINFIRF